MVARQGIFQSKIIHALAKRPGLSSRVCFPRLTARARTEEARGSEDGRGSNIGNYCSLDENKKKKEMSLMEKETEFLLALQAYYVDGKSSMSDEDFEALKEELIWSGSSVAVLSSNEQKFLEATLSFNKGKKMLSDEEFDTLKAKLREEGSSVVQAGGPRCSLRSKRVFTDAVPDYLKLTLLNLPAAALVLGILFGIDFLTSFSFITPAVELPPPWSILILWGVVLPSVYVLSASITNLILPGALILKAECPNCGEPTLAYFGGILNINNYATKEALVECSSCKADLSFSSVSREVVLVATNEEKKAAKAAAKLAKAKK